MGYGSLLNLLALVLSSGAWATSFKMIPPPKSLLLAAPAAAPVAPLPRVVETPPIPPKLVDSPKTCTACVFEQQYCASVTIREEDGENVNTKMRKCQGYPKPSARHSNSNGNLPNPNRSHCFYDSTKSNEFPHGFCYSQLKRECEQKLAQAKTLGPTKLVYFSEDGFPNLQQARKTVTDWYEGERAAGRCSQIHKTENRHGITGSLLAAYENYRTCKGAQNKVDLDSCGDGALYLPELRKLAQSVSRNNSTCSDTLEIRTNQCTTTGYWNGLPATYIFNQNSCQVRLDSCEEAVRRKCYTGHPGASAYGWCAEEGQSVCMVCSDNQWKKAHVEKPAATAEEKEDANRQLCINDLKTQPPKNLTDNCFSIFDVVGNLKSYSCENKCRCVYGVGTTHPEAFESGVSKSTIQAFDESDAIKQVGSQESCFKLCKQARPEKELSNYSPSDNFPRCSEVK